VSNDEIERMKKRISQVELDKAGMEYVQSEVEMLKEMIKKSIGNEL